MKATTSTSTLTTTTVARSTLNPMLSRSTLSQDLSRILADLAHNPHLDNLRQTVSGILANNFNRSIDHNKFLNAEECAVVAQVCNVELVRFLQGAGFVRNINNGEVGIAFNTSYACATVDDSTVDVEDVSAPVVFRRDGQLIKVNLNVAVALANGHYTTWSVTTAKPIDDHLGHLQFLATTFDQTAATTRQVGQSDLDLAATAQ